ncbi:hypothetical protein ABKN59_009607 [Abortiporus biennis]
MSRDAAAVAVGCVGGKKRKKIKRLSKERRRERVQRPTATRIKISARPQDPVTNERPLLSPRGIEDSERWWPLRQVLI